MGTTDKPRGLAKARRDVAVTNTIIENFSYEEDDTDDQSEEEPGDDLEFPGTATDCIVCAPSHLLLNGH